MTESIFPLVPPGATREPVDVDWTIATIWDSVAAAAPQRAAIVCGDTVLRWGKFEQRARVLSHALFSVGSPAQAKVVVFLRNTPEFMEIYYAAFKAALIPVNANWRYGATELAYLIENADAEIIFFGAEFVETIDKIRDTLPLVRWWIMVGGDADVVPEWAVDYEALVARQAPENNPRRSRPDDALILYTGGTTGLPKGVVWRQADLIHVLGAGADPVGPLPPLARAADAGPRALAISKGEIPGRGLMLTPAPLIHATALFTSLSVLISGATIGLLQSRSFNAVDLFDEAERIGAEVITIAGQGFAVPMLEALEALPGRWTLPLLRRIGSSGTIWSVENKAALLACLPHVELVDSLGSSEAIGMASSISTVGAVVEGARFTVNENVAVFDAAWQRVAAGTGAEGMLALSGRIPAGYYKDPAKTAGTFRQIDGRRWSIPGDMATVEGDGTIRLLGRGSTVINTGGEKVFPEEVEGILRQHCAVRDVLVLGSPDDRLSERINAIVELRPRKVLPSAADLIAHVRTDLAAYKAPRTIVFATVPRLANGKPDYAAAQAMIAASKASSAEVAQVMP